MDRPGYISRRDSIYNFSGLKYIKKGYIEMTKKIFFEPPWDVSQVDPFHTTPASIAEAASVIPNAAKTRFAKGIATFINRPANLFNNDGKNPPDWIILEIWVSESFKSVDVLLLNALLNFGFCLAVNNN